MPRPAHKLDIQEIEWGVDGCRYFSRGHHDPKAFIEALDRYGDFRERIKPEDVKHGRMRSWPDRTGNYSRYYQDAAPGPGAFPVTYVESK